MAMQSGLIRRAKRGDATAMDEIVRLHYNDIYHFLCRKLPNYMDAQDIAQDVFLKLAIRISAYQERGKLKNYLFQMALNASRDYYRKAERTVGPLAENADFAADTVPLDQMMEASERGVLVKAALNSLPDYQRDVIVLRFYHDLAFKDIAAITGAHVSSTKSRYRQGMDKLRASLKEVFQDERQEGE